MSIKVNLRFGNSHTMADFTPADYEAELERVLNDIYPSYDTVFTGQLLDLQKGNPRMGQRKVKVTSYPHERERCFYLFVQPKDNGTCLKVKLEIPSSFSATEVFEKVKLRTPAVKVKIRQNDQDLTLVTTDQAKQILIKSYTSDLLAIETEINEQEARLERLRAERDRLGRNLTHLEEIC